MAKMTPLLINTTTRAKEYTTRILDLIVKIQMQRKVEKVEVDIKEIILEAIIILIEEIVTETLI